MYRSINITNSSSHPRRSRKTALLRAVADSLFEPLESRRLYSVTASAAGSVLTVLGDDNANVINVSHDAAGNLLVNGGSVQIAGSPATLASIQSIHVSGLGGNDTITLDETNGALPPASLSGGSGNDTLTGGSGADTLNGDAGNDVLLGKAGNDQLLGGSGDDTLTGGTGADQAFGEAGQDRTIWNPGDGSDTNEGGDGIDVVEVNGGNVAEAFTVESAGSRVHFQRVSPGPFSIDIGTSESLVLNANGGDDSFSGGTGLAGKMSLTVDGGAGNDTLAGTDGADTLIGGDGNDFVDGNAGSDVAMLGSGDDVFKWDPGDGSDIVEGQQGADLMIFNGSAAGENVDLSAHAGRLRFFRDVGTITMDVNDVESVTFNALAGADKVTVHDLHGTDVTRVSVNLEGSPGVGDGGADTVIVEGSKAVDHVAITGSAGSGVAVDGLSAGVSIIGAESTDRLNVNTFSGADVVNATGLDANSILLTADGGRGRDVLLGGAGNDTLFGGAGADILVGGAGTDQLDGGAGNNTIIP